MRTLPSARSLRRSRWATLVSLLIAVVAEASAQDTTTSRSGISIGGSLSIGHDLYSIEATPDGSTGARRPASLLRLLVAPTISFGESVTLPFNFMLTIPETTTEPRPATNGTLDLLQNPANSFSLSPTFGWARFDLGTHSPQLSELSGGNIQLFGLGVDLTPGSFRIAASAGTVGRAAAVDTAGGTRGAYARQAYMGKIAYVADETELAVNVVRVRDDASSIPTLLTTRILHPDTSDLSIADTIVERSRLMPFPEESFTATISAKIPIADGASVTAEGGGSLFTRDMIAGTIAEPIDAIDPVMTQRVSTRADIAGKLGIEIANERWGVMLGSSYIGAGYKTLAYPWMPADRLDVTLSPRVALFDDGLALSGSIGWRQNNLSQTEGSTTTQLLGSITADARISDALSVVAIYTNHGMRNTLRDDTLRIENVSQTMSLTPTLTIATDALTHTLVASVSLDDYTDYNPITGAEGSNRTRGATGVYSLSLADLPISLELSGSWLANRLSIGELEITSGSVGVGYTLFDDALALGATASLTRTSLDGTTPDEGLTLRLTGSWRASDRIRLRVDGSTTSYRYGASRAGESFDETLVRSTLQFHW